ncbi:hypothetical protein OAN33_05855 [Flavobacteriales bacterium]|nr:hypothetical protein [Flavobacteriales bacterium]
MFKRFALAFSLWINFFLVFPCGWDSDTIAMEKRMFPTVHELITGKFLQHSQEFYYWRVTDRKEKIILYPDSLNLYDDLAWALNKVGEPEKGIEVMFDKESITPGLYKTYANLGTCYIHSKQFEEGLKYIKKAIEMNPKAHFGREVYQQYLVEYVISKKDSLGNFSVPLGTKKNNFFHYLKKYHFSGTTSSEIAKAVKGVGGMMKFSNHNSPILLEALGDLLSNAENGHDPGAGHLSSRAYLKAALLSKKDAAVTAYKKRANQERERQFAGANRRGRDPHFSNHVISLADLETVLKLEIQAANVWVEEIKKNELGWIAGGMNPDSAFSITYYEEPTSKSIGKYTARKNKSQIEEEYWLNQHLKNINKINNGFTILQLPDSTKNWVDSIYKIEFSVLPEKNTENQIPDIYKVDEKKQINNENSGIWIVIVSVSGMVIIIIGSRFLFKK